MRDRVLIAGLAIRVALIALATPALHIAALANAFGPYGGGQVSSGDGVLLQWLVLVIAAIGNVAGVSSVLLGLVVLAADLATYRLLANTGSIERREEVARLYWLSPLVIWLAYCHGTLAPVAAAAAVTAFIAIERRRWVLAGLGFGVACGCYPALAVLLAPVALLFCVGLARVRVGAREMAAALGGVLLVAVALPDALTWALAGTPPGGALGGLFALHLPLGPAAAVAVLPLLLATLLYAMWRVRLIDRDLLWTFCTLALLAAIVCGAGTAEIALIGGTMLCHHSAYAERSGRAGLVLLSALLLVGAALQLPGPVIDRVADGLPLVRDDFGATLLWMLPTALAIVAGVIATQVAVRGIARSHTYLVTRRPIAIGVAGDSGVGKDTLVDGVAALFSPRTVASISGDDYHNWDRNKPMWRALTHLNPRANDLALFARHVTQLVDRRWVRARHYDHKTGRMTKPLLLHPGEIVIASGLHALTSTALNPLYDLRVYLDMDEALRRHFKIRRDVDERGQPLERVVASIERRQADATAYVHPQRNAADVVFRLIPRRQDLLTHAGRTVPTRLIVEAAPGVGFDPVTRALVAVAGIYAVELPGEGGRSHLIVEGEPSPADLAAAARRLPSVPEELMRDAPAWEGGTIGVMQLVMLHLIEQVRTRRSVNA